MYSTSAEYKMNDYTKQVAQEKHIYMFHFFGKKTEEKKTTPTIFLIIF